MTSKILIADDSLTIQKVINITLANSGYELFECLNEEDLLKKIESNDFDLILLDFNLSDTKSGYELSKLIHSKLPEAKIMVMLGTFDTVDESQFTGNGIADKIVKPFESSKFIKRCKDLLENNLLESFSTSVTDSNESEIDMEAPQDELASLNDWTMDAPKIGNDNDLYLDESSELSDLDSLDPLSSEMEGWGFGPTNAIEEKFQKEFPEEVSEEILEDHSEDVLSRLQESSNFELDDLSFEEDTNATDPHIDLSSIMTNSLESEIADEISADDFWAVDEIVPFESVDKTSIENNNFEEVTADLTEKVNDYVNKYKEEISFTAVSENKTETKKENLVAVNEDAIVEKLKLAIRPMLEEMVKEFCQKQAERVAWEVIPDLAENLIKKEIKEISESVKH